MLKIRPHRITDISYRLQWLNNPTICRFVGNEPATFFNQLKWFTNYLFNSQKKFFTILKTKRPIGFMGLSKIDYQLGRAELFIIIGEDDCRHQGLGRKAMEWLLDYAATKLQLKELRLEVIQDNLAAIKLYQKLGFKEISRSDSEIQMVLTL